MVVSADFSSEAAHAGEEDGSTSVSMLWPACGLELYVNDQSGSRVAPVQELVESPLIDDMTAGATVEVESSDENMGIRYTDVESATGYVVDFVGKRRLT